MDTRLFREENQQWIEKVVITRIWIGNAKNFSEDALEQLRHHLDAVLQNLLTPLSAPATHAAQTVSLVRFSYWDMPLI
jgi:histone H3/H4